MCALSEKPKTREHRDNQYVPTLESFKISALYYQETTNQKSKKRETSEAKDETNHFYHFESFKTKFNI